MGEKSDQFSTVKRALIELRDMRSRLDDISYRKHEPIAIIGAALRFPGGAIDLESYWRLLLNGVDSIREVPPERWDIEAYFDQDPDAPGKMYSRHGGFLDQIDSFDPDFFGISPREAVNMDPQQRLLLEVGWEAMETAGQSPGKLAGSQTGVFVGIGLSDYSRLAFADPESIDAYAATGNTFSVTASRLSYLLNLKGPSMAVDTACSSSLVAAHLAVRSLRAGECNTALVGGVNLIITPEFTINFCKARMLSVEGRCRTFDADADGYVRGEGCAMIIAKRLSDAEADGDNILGLILGTAVNQDGRSAGITAPNGPAQEEVISSALRDGKVEPHEVGYIETHGTGTPLGDPIEASALGEVMGRGKNREHPLSIGSVKTNIGHLEAAAGIAGLLKVVLALKHGVIPPHLHFKEANPHIPLDKLPLMIPTEAIPWSPGRNRKIAGVSSFGFSGTNAHVVLEAPREVVLKDIDEDRPRHLLTLSTKNESALIELIDRFGKYLGSNTNEPLADVCYTASTGRHHFGHRFALVTHSAEEASRKLASASQSGEAPDSFLFRLQDDDPPPRMAFLFTGQGSQYVGMGRWLYETQPGFRKSLERCDEILKPYLGETLISVLYPESKLEAEKDVILTQTAFTQPALFAIEYAIAMLWQSWGIKPSAVMGHSVGEYVAACVAGVFSLEDGLKLIAERGRLMQSLPEGGRMAAVFADEGKVLDALSSYREKVSIAALNGPENIVISGEGPDIEEILKKLEAEGIEFAPLKVSHAFHSPLMAPILDTFEKAAEEVSYSAPRLKLISNLTGQTAKADEIGQGRWWRRHMREPVMFSASMETLYRENYRIFVEIGPHPVLLGMGAQCLPEGEGVWLPSLRRDKEDWQQMLESLGELYVRGAEVDWVSYDRDYPRRKVTLPTYPFQRKRYWIADGNRGQRAQEMTLAGSRKTGLHPLLGERLRSPDIEDIVFSSSISINTIPFLKSHRIFGMIIFPATGYLEMILSGARSAFGPENHSLEDIAMEKPLIFNNEEPRTLQLILSSPDQGVSRCRIFSIGKDEAGREGEWVQHVSGQIRICRKGEDAFRQTRRGEFDDLRKRCSRERDGEEYYWDLSERGIELGTAFQTVEALWQGTGEALGCFRLPEDPFLEIGDYHAHPVLLDGCLQILGTIIMGGAENSGQGNAYLPMGFGRMRVRDGLGKRCWSHARVHQKGGEDPETISADLQMFDDDGKILAHIDGFVVKRADSKALEHAKEGLLEHWLYKVHWQPKDLESAESSSAEGTKGQWLVFSDHKGTGDGLVSHLAAHGERCITVYPGQAYEVIGKDRFTIDPMEPKDYEKLFEALFEGNGMGLRGVVHFWSIGSDTVDYNKESLEVSQALSCGSVISLLQTLAERTSTNSPRLWLVTQGAQSVGGSSSLPHLSQTPIWGIGRVIALEHPELRCVRIDLDPEGGMDDLKQLVDEVRGGDREDQVAYRGKTRYVMRLLRRSSRFANAEKIDSESTYLVTGGFGGIGLKVAQWMVTEGARNLVLMGRSSPSSEAIEAIGTMENQGARILIAQGDVTRREDLQRIFSEIKARAIPLKGIIHAAGILDDGVLREMEWSRFLHVMAPKVLGSWHLHQLSRKLPLDFFILFSSISSTLGTMGQGNYAAANAFMDGLAHFRRGNSQPALSINWGPWGEIGMAASLNDRDRGRLVAQGISPMAPDQALGILGMLLPSHAVQVAVLSVRWPKFLRAYPAGMEPPVMGEISQEIRSREKTSSATRKEGGIKELLEETLESERREVLISFVHAQVAKVLGRNPSEPLDGRTPFTALGLDSLMAVQLRNLLASAMGNSLPTSLVYDYSTIEALSDFLELEVLGLQLSADGNERPPENEENWEKVSEELDELSQADLAKLLESRLSAFAKE